MSAPIVVAKGSGASAEHIRRVAAEHGIPAVEQKRLARALYRRVDPNQPIPADQYVAVAEVLTQVVERLLTVRKPVATTDGWRVSKLTLAHGFRHTVSFAYPCHPTTFDSQ